MGPRYECAPSVLCTENNSSILGLDDDDMEEVEVGRGVDEAVRRSDFVQDIEKSCEFYGDVPMARPPLQSEDCIGSLLEKETQHLPREDYAKRLLDGSIELALREDAIDWIENVGHLSMLFTLYSECALVSNVRIHYNFGPLTAYLSINYLDRFLSTREYDLGQAWVTQLLSVVCLSIAAKVEETKVPLSLDLQVEKARYIFDGRTIQRMELTVLRTLEWRMQAITPFSFIHYFLNKFRKESLPDFSSVNRSEELILHTIRDRLRLQQQSHYGLRKIIRLWRSLNLHPRMEKERVLRCYDIIQNMALMKRKTYMDTNPSDSSAQRSPIGVLDVACMSYKSNDITVGSPANSHQTSPIAKRKKLESLS